MAETQSLLTTLYPKMAEPITKAMNSGWTEEQMKGEMIRRVEKAKFLGKDPADLFGLTPDTQKTYDTAVNNRKTKILSEAFGLNQDNLKDTVSMSLNMGISPSFAVKNMNMYRDIKKIKGDLVDPLDYVTEKVRNEAKTLADAGRIMSTFDGGYRTKDSPTNFNNTVGYMLNKPFSALIEKPLFAMNQLGWETASGLFKVAENMGWDDPDVRNYLDGQVEYWGKPEIYGDATRFASAVEQSQNELAEIPDLEGKDIRTEHAGISLPQRQMDAEMKSALAKTAAHTVHAATDLTMMMAQMHMLGAALGGFATAAGQQMMGSSAVRVLSEFKNLATLHGTHAFLTTSGTMEDRLKAGLYRIAYNATPLFVNETLGLAGGKAVFADFLSNSVLTSPHYWQILNSDMPNADKVSLIIPQIIMDFFMSRTTRGSLESRQKIQDAKSTENINKKMDESVRQYADRVERITGRPADETYKQQMDEINKKRTEFEEKNFIERDKSMKREADTGIDPWDRKPEPEKPLEIAEVKSIHEEIGDTGEEDDIWFDGRWFDAQSSKDGKSEADLEREEIQRHSADYRAGVLKAIREEGGIDREGTGKIWSDTEAKELGKRLGPAYMKKGKGLSLDKLHQVLVDRGTFKGSLDDLYSMLMARPSAKSKKTMVTHRDLPKPKDIRADRKESFKAINEHFGKTTIGDLFLGGGRRVEGTTKTNREELKGLVRYVVYLANRASSPSVYGKHRYDIEAILSDYDLHIRNENTMAILKDVEAELGGDAEGFKALARTDQFRFIEDGEGNHILKENLNSLTVKELTDVVDIVLDLREEGRKAYEQVKATQKQDFDDQERSILGKIGTPKRNDRKVHGTMEERSEDRQTHTWEAAKAESMRPARIADAIDGFEDYAGPAYKFFIERTDANENIKLSNWFRRKDIVEKALERAGVTEKDLARPFMENREWVKGKAEVFSLDTCLDIYAARQNELKWAAVIHGNGISRDVAEKIVAKVEANPKLKGLVWDIIKEYDSEFGRYQDSLLEVANLYSPREKNYTPMIRRRSMEKSGKMVDDVMAARRDEIMRVHNMRKQYASRKHGYQRNEWIPDDKQEPIKLGLIECWHETVMENEHFTAHAQHVRNMHAMLGDPENADMPTVAKTIDVNKGRATLDAMRNYANRVAVPDFYKSGEMVSKAARLVKHNVAMAYLGYNLLTIGKQAPSLAFYTAEANPVRMLSACFDLALHPKRTLETIHRLDPEMKQRSLERVLEEMKREDVESWKKVKQRIGVFGMEGIRRMDKAVTSIGWWAVYNKGLDNGLSVKEAALRAKRITLNTQPAAQAKELAKMYASSDEWFNLAIMFTNQLNNVWNMSVHDVGGYAKSGKFGHALSYTISILVASMMMDIIRHGRMPEDGKEWGRALAYQEISSIPLAGKYLSGQMEGYMGGADPFQKFFGGVAAGVDSLDDGEMTWNAGKKVWEAISLWQGLPYTGLRRITEAAKDPDDAVKILMGWQKPGSKGSKKNRPW